MCLIYSMSFASGGFHSNDTSMLSMKLFAIESFLMGVSWVDIETEDVFATVLGRDNGRGKVKSALTPFRITTKVTDGVATWEVSHVGSSVIDGTNGDNLLGPELFNVPQQGSGYVVLSVTISNTGEPGTWSLGLSSETDEVEFSGDDQTEARLVIGKVEEDASGGLIAKQGVTTAFMLTHGFYNGKIVRVFAAAPSHPGSL